jgi:hypothetical protein
MWIKKTDEDIKNDLEKSISDISLFKVPLLISLLVICLTIFSEIIGGTDISIRKPMNFLEIIENPFKPILMGVIFFIIAYLNQKNKIKKLLSENIDFKTSLICEKCHKVKNYNEVYLCECGGDYIDLNKMKWIEGDDDDDNSSTKDSLE